MIIQTAVETSTNVRALTGRSAQPLSDPLDEARKAGHARGADQHASASTFSRA
ncbi:MAG: hypothetical protein U5M50_09975 [Sphingobium sp.]|nr:hypothetical protein [Sphingobium sp.]